MLSLRSWSLEGDIREDGNGVHCAQHVESSKLGHKICHTP